MMMKIANLFIHKFFRLLGFFTVDLYIALKNVLGKDRALEIMRSFMVFLGRTRAPIMAKMLKSDLSDMASLSKIQDTEDFILGVKGIWLGKGKDLAIKDELFCPFARKLKGHSEFCQILVRDFELATFKTLNQNYELSIEGKLLSEGGKYCRFIHKIK
jgi:hypothetical protein